MTEMSAFLKSAENLGTQKKTESTQSDSGRLAGSNRRHSCREILEMTIYVVVPAVFFSFLLESIKNLRGLYFKQQIEPTMLDRVFFFVFKK